jgi:hypothetical protein
VGAARPDAFAAARRLLAPLIAERGTGRRGVDAGLVRVYEGVIFRALAAPNARLRLTAATMLSDVLFMGAHAESAREGRRLGRDAPGPPRAPRRWPGRRKRGARLLPAW